jgi:tRNA A-37 threonylcarbamoyl transferase component Bud32
MPDRKLLARGTTADVYEWGEGRVLKLFNPSQSRDSVEYEASTGKIVVSAGLAVPQVYEVLEENGCWGIVYERISGSELSDLLRPWNAQRHGRTMARLHVTLFTQHIQDLPRQRDRLTRRVSTSPGFSEADRRRLLNQLYSLPDSDLLCHGDFHMANLIRTEQGLIIIDWMDATQGHPTADIARTILILEELTETIDWVMPQVLGADSKLPGWAKRLFASLLRDTLRRLLRGYREEIERLVPEAKALIPRWMPVLAAARLHEGQYTELVSSPEMQQVQQQMIDRMRTIARAGLE